MPLLITFIWLIEELFIYSLFIFWYEPKTKPLTEVSPCSRNQLMARNWRRPAGAEYCSTPLSSAPRPRTRRRALNCTRTARSILTRSSSSSGPLEAAPSSRRWPTRYPVTSSLPPKPHQFNLVCSGLIQISLFIFHLHTYRLFCIILPVLMNTCRSPLRV